MTREREHAPSGWKPKVLRVFGALRRALSPPELRIRWEEGVLLEGATTKVRWHTDGALFVRVKGYGRCRAQGAMCVVLSPPFLDIAITAYGLAGKMTVRVWHPVLPIKLKVTPHMAAPFRTEVNGPIPMYDPSTPMRSADLGYAKGPLSFKRGHPVIHGRMPQHIEIEEPELNQHHVVQRLLDA